MRIEPAELSVVELRVQGNLVAHIFWDVRSIGAVIGRTSPAGPFGSEVSDSSPTAKVVESSGLPISLRAGTFASFPAGEIAKISTLNCLSCKKFFANSY